MSKHIEIAKKEHREKAKEIKMQKPEEFNAILKKMANTKSLNNKDLTHTKEDVKGNKN